MVAIADDAPHQRRFKLKHGVPGHGHDVGVPIAAVVTSTTGPGSSKP